MTVSVESNASVEKQREHFNSIAERYFAARNHANHLALKGLSWKSFFDRNPGISEEMRRVLEPTCGMGEGYKSTNSRRLNVRGLTSEEYARDDSQETKNTQGPTKCLPDFEYSLIYIKHIRLRYFFGY
jgi:hypothetical protein